MKKMIQQSFCIIFLLNSSAGFAVAPYFSIRSQSENAARELVGAGWNTQINLCCMDSYYGNFSIAAEYSRSFKPCHIAQCLFGCLNSCCGGSGCVPCSGGVFNPCCSTDDASDSSYCTPCGTNGFFRLNCDDCYRIKVSGSQVENRGTCDWLADYFGLPTDYQSCVAFEPRINNFLVDFNFYLGLDEWCQGMYFRVHAPIVHTQWDLNMCECIQDSGSNNHWPGYFNSAITMSPTATYGIDRGNLVSSFASFIGGCDVINSSGLLFNPLCYAKMTCCKFKETALSDIQMALGWNCCCCEDYHVGLNIRAAAPTGTRPKGVYLFEPIVGNGKHWELGAGLSSHMTCWRDGCDCRCLELYFDANVTHLFKARQCRTFDLCGKPLGRYMLAAKFKTPVENLLAGVDEQQKVPSKQFSGIYSPVANLTTFPVDVSVGMQADLVLMLQYVCNNWSFDFGYNFWGKSCEKIECPCDCCLCFEENTWGLKGDSFMYGYNDSVMTPTIGAVALSATQPKATICKGTNNYPDGDVDAALAWEQNPGVVNRKRAWDTELEQLYIPNGGTGPEMDEIYTSLDPVLLNFCDIDLCGARTKGRSHKLFVHFDYSWCDCECRKPYLGLGMEVEFAQKPCDDSCDNCTSCCCAPCSSPCTDLLFERSCVPCYNPASSGCVCCNNCCNLCAVSQWGVWLKGGFSF